MEKIILASKSPRRQEIMSLGGLTYTVKISKEEEQIPEGEVASLTPGELVERLARIKAEDVYRLCEEEPDVMVIGADTVVSVDGSVLGKPKSEAQARDMLLRLSGRTHEVYTGVCLVWNHADEGQKKREKVFHCMTEVTFYPMDMEEIDAYIRTGDCMDKAGAYGIQSGAAKFIREIRGDYFNVVGLPLSRLYQEMKKTPFDVVQNR